MFGPLPRLVNIPQSHVVGFELSGIWRPIDGLTITPSLSYSSTRIDGCDGNAPTGLPGCHNGDFFAYDYQPALQKVTGESFPGVPELQADVDAEYDWRLTGDVSAFIGGNVNYQGSDYSGLGEPGVYRVADYALLDLRAGIERGNLRVQVYGRNVTNKFYVNNKVAVVDAFTRYTGMPATYGVTVSYRFK